MESLCSNANYFYYIIAGRYFASWVGYRILRSFFENFVVFNGRSSFAVGTFGEYIGACSWSGVRAVTLTDQISCLCRSKKRENAAPGTKKAPEIPEPMEAAGTPFCVKGAASFPLLGQTEGPNRRNPGVLQGVGGAGRRIPRGLRSRCPPPVPWLLRRRG